MALHEQHGMNRPALSGPTPSSPAPAAPRPAIASAASDPQPSTHVCGILPPYLLAHLATALPETSVGDAAVRTLRVQRELRGRRELRSALNPPGHRSGSQEPRSTNAGIIPDRLRTRPQVPADRIGELAKPTSPAGAASPQRSIYDAQHKSTLPGVLRRREGDAAHSDDSVNEAYDGLGHTWSLYHDVYGRNSLDDAGLPLTASVHFEQNYDNAFWDGQQMVFGDGDGEIFLQFTDCIDVIGHELTHGFTQYTAGFVYVGQSGALNEHVSDVFGILTLQRAQGQSAQAADWLIGKGLFAPGVKGVALRSMKAPGTAYDDPRLGKDPQPATMADYAEMPHDDANDNGGVHVNSGIPNHAFYLIATELGGNAWERAGQIWYDVMTSAGLAKDCDFVAFAEATVAAAQKRYGASSAEASAVRSGWTQVGVLGGSGVRSEGRHRKE